MVRWFCDAAAHRDEDGLTLCRVKNKFARSAEAEDGYRDVSLSLLFSHASGLRVVGEVPSLSDLQNPRLVPNRQPRLRRGNHCSEFRNPESPLP